MFVFSTGNTYLRNGLGLLLVNGWHAGGLKASDRNFLQVTSDGDVLVGNDLGTLVENALITLDAAVPSSENRIRLEIVAGTFVDNGQNLDARAWVDARPGSLGTVGSENTVELLIRETRSAGPAAFHICDGSPAEPSNRVILFGPAVAFEKSNDNVVIVRCSG